MKNEKQQQARNLYFQTKLSKTEIAKQLGINRRTVMIWCHQGNWDTLKQSAQHMPSIMAERCYLLIGHVTRSLLQRDSIHSTVNIKEAETIHKLACSIKKLKTRNTVNESMEMFNFFLMAVQKKDPEMAQSMMPFIEEYIKSRTDVSMCDNLSDEFNEYGELPYPEKEITEKWQDEKDWESMAQELHNAGGDTAPLSFTLDNIAHAATLPGSPIDLSNPDPQPGTTQLTTPDTDTETMRPSENTPQPNPEN